MFNLNIFSSLAKPFRTTRATRRTSAKSLLNADAIRYENLENRQLLAGDVVLQWNETLLDAIRTTRPSPPVATRAMAIVHTAIYDAVNSIFNHYEPYAVSAAVHPKASAHAAVAAAAERTLSHLFPSLQSTFLDSYSATLAMVPDGIREDQGVAAGRYVADKILELRAGDGWDIEVPYSSESNAGDWIPTAPGFLPPVLPNWGNVTPWAMENGSEFRPETPPALDSERYAIDYNMVKELGAIDSATRTIGQTYVAKIWEGKPGTATPPGQWNMIAQEIALSEGNNIYQNARMFAMLNVALADAAICAWDAKYEYDYWRPITAIQNGDLDDNPATDKDADWTPLLTTPPFPTYTSGHSTFSGAGSSTLAGFFGTDQLNFKLVSEVPGVPDRYFSSLTHAANEAGFSRIFGGIHYNFDNVEALKSGRGIGQMVSSTMLQARTEVIAHVGGTNLYVAGTTANDNIHVYRSGENIVVRNHGQLVGKYSAAGLFNVVTNGSYGNDRINVSNNVPMTTEQFGGEGNDIIFGSNNMNWLYGEGGEDQLFGGASDDVLMGGEGNDHLYGKNGKDYLDAGAGWNWLYGGRDDDSLFGTRGKDRLFGGLGSNSLYWR